MRFAFAPLALIAAAALPASSSAQSMLCTNTCSTAFDNECDDGGPGSLYSICELGSDCSDCGPRPQANAAPPAPAGMDDLCTNTCSTAFDNECDDGGPGSLYSICDYGSDCSDCGRRPVERQPSAPAHVTGLCTNTCSSAFDNECDDGGPGSLYSICELGSDCSDCGVRQPGDLGNTQRLAVPGTICTNTCGSANDNECDDGGPNSLYSVCRYGTDCNDCGARAPMAGCSNTCATSNDNECDDGGPGSIYSICSLGTDCSDCGPR
jgi:hypothetical protein